MNQNTKKAIIIIIKGIIIVVISIILTSIASTLAFHLRNSYPEYNTVILVMSEILCTVITLLIVYLFFTVIDKTSFSEIGLKFDGNSSDIIKGCVISLIIILIGTLFIIIFGNVTIETFQIQASYIVASFIITILTAINEEIIFRGYILNKLSKVINLHSSLLISSLLFSIPHLINPNLSFLAAVNTFLAGILIGLMFMKNRNLWFPISFHVFWNTFQALAGYNISGVEMPTFFTLSYERESFINGGSFGFEGSIICSILLAIGVIVFYVKYKKEAIVFK